MSDNHWESGPKSLKWDSESSEYCWMYNPYANHLLHSIAPLGYGKCIGRGNLSENDSICTSTKAMCPKLRRDSLGWWMSNHLRFGR
ncbi:hypothetical protein NPIL_481271 [Nephila pilipes]|uniref:Uncharacterized protein n=1 Tax=Nephila pilipes TaxID=299642 RepID=A0A8X6NW89_NEPPI|nr:hypothetical protein NPIL_481271 [Nephila pilipes]